MMDLKIQFLDFADSESVRSAVESHAEALEKSSDRIMSCHVLISKPHRKLHQGGLYHIKLRLHMPGTQIVVDKESGLNHAHEDIYVAIRDAFLAARRKVEDYARVQSGNIKLKNGPQHARIVRIFYGEGYGFMRSEDQREIYFHRNSVINEDFENLNVGQEVRFSEEMGENGPQATSVRPLGRTGHRPTYSLPTR